MVNGTIENEVTQIKAQPGVYDHRKDALYTTILRPVVDSVRSDISSTYKPQPQSDKALVVELSNEDLIGDKIQILGQVGGSKIEL